MLKPVVGGQYQRRRLFALAVGCLLFGGAQPAFAYALWDNYVPPEVAFSDDLRQSVRLPAKININHGTLNQLMGLPGFDEEVALKVLRTRPFEDIQDFYRKMPGMDKHRIDRLIQQVQPKLMFK